MGMGFAPTWLRQVSPQLHMTTNHCWQQAQHFFRVILSREWEITEPSKIEPPNQTQVLSRTEPNANPKVKIICKNPN